MPEPHKPSVLQDLLILLMAPDTYFSVGELYDELACWIPSLGADSGEIVSALKELEHRGTVSLNEGKDFDDGINRWSSHAQRHVLRKPKLKIIRSPVG